LADNEEEEEEKEQGISDDMSDAISKLIDDEDDPSVFLGVSEQNNLSNVLRHGVMSKLGMIGLQSNIAKRSDINLSLKKL
jgi:hypothetical protein